jgi:hypothetical protein
MTSILSRANKYDFQRAKKKKPFARRVSRKRSWSIELVLALSDAPGAKSQAPC